MAEKKFKKRLIKNKKTRIKKKMSKKIRDFEKKRRADVIKKFSKKVLDKYGPYVKAIVAWGSVVRNEFHSKSDIDVVILIDDTRGNLTKKIRGEIDDFMFKAAEETDKMLSPQPVWTITEFVSMTRRCSPLAYNLLKDGVAVYDTGFFLTHKRLLERGEMPLTKEAVENRMENVPKRLRRAQHAKMYIIAEDLYYACLDSLQAVVMFMGRGPPDANHAAEVGRKYLVENKLTKEETIKIIEDIINFRKKTEHKEVKDIKGEEVDKFIERAKKFVKEMERVLKILESNRKAKDVEKTYEVMIKASVAALKSLNKLPKDPKELPSAFKKHLIESGLVNPAYENVLVKVLEMKKLVNEKKIDEINERDINISKEYVRRFIGSVRKMAAEKEIKCKVEAKEENKEQKSDKK
ncbi:MAG: nucleotidyltransferase domain-containing protein [Candidatus Aenigmarchaeota archaeon]|nr:nucleotidyltransferase domain-containing protein [Candidatus Aenigmarchaeota archaeon]